MRLRRGMVRESCDFCHRRKIKCDRLSRNDLGHASCSQCSLRSVQCCMDDSDDIRLRGRCRPAPSSSVSMLLSPSIRAPSPATPSPSSTSSPSTITRRTIRQKAINQTPLTSSVGPPASINSSILVEDNPVSPSLDEQSAERTTRSSYSSGFSSQRTQQQLNSEGQVRDQDQSLHVSQSLPAASLATPASINLDVDSDNLLVQPPPSTGNILPESSLPYDAFNSDAGVDPINTCLASGIPQPSSMTEELMFLDDPFHLNADSIFFLDKIFMGYPDPSASGPAWPNPSSETQPLVFTQSVLSTMPPEGQSFGTNTLNQQSQPSYMSQTLPPRLQGQQQQLQQQAQQDQQPQQQQSSTATAFKPSTQLKDGGYDPPPWTRCGLDEDTFVNALKAYFSHVTLYLPILLEDAFCQDYNTGRCSLSIIYAVACRGLPFTCPSADKTEMWAQQQRVAEQFREAFFAAQLGANNNRGRVRLDDLEALALMVYFKYNDAASASSDTPASSSATALTQLHAHLTSLYLTHDSLVLMTMQSGIDTPDAVNNASATSASATATDPKAPLARLNDRRILLFWHVYGLDAFHCLDKKLISRIPDCNHHMLLPVTGAASGGSTASPIKKNLPCHSKEAATARGYLDAILDLAILARQALISLSNATARRRGVRAEDLETVYGLLEQWQRVGCPPHLRRQRDPVTKKLSLTAGLDSNSNTHIVQLHRAVVWILEINCYLQIEDCVCEYGIYEPTSSSSTTPMIPTLDTEALALRYEAETVCRLRDGVEIARSMLAYKPDSNGHNATRQGQYALADLGKSIIRDCCYGLAQWACLRGSQQLRRALPSMMEARRPRAEIEGATAALSDRQRQRISSYIEAAKVLRDAVATAVSHADTEPAVNTLNGMISSLKTQMEEMSATG